MNSFFAWIIILFLLIFSAIIRYFIDKKIAQKQLKRKNSVKIRKHKSTSKEIGVKKTKKNNINSDYIQMIIENTPDKNIEYPKKDSGLNSAAVSRIENLSVLQKAVIWADIIGPPKGLQ